MHTFTAFWLDFEGLGPLGGFKKQEKTAPGKSCFFGLKSKVPKSVFYDFRVSFGSHFGALGRPKMGELIFRFFFGVGALPGPFWDHFWLHFTVFSGLLLKRFGIFSVMFPSLGSRWGFWFFQSETWSRPRRRRGRRPFEVHKCSGIHLDRALLLNALPVPLLRQVHFECLF